MDTLDRGSFFIGNTIANLRGMDPTFGTRTLTLVDGRRVVSTVQPGRRGRPEHHSVEPAAAHGRGHRRRVGDLRLRRHGRRGQPGAQQPHDRAVNLDVDYGVNEAGDGGSPHFSLSGGTPLFGGRGHVLLGVGVAEARTPSSDCAEARDWCAESRALFTNSSRLGATNPAGMPARCPASRTCRPASRWPTCATASSRPPARIYHNNANFTSGYRFTTDGTDVEEYAYGFRGGTRHSAMQWRRPADHLRHADARQQRAQDAVHQLRVRLHRDARRATCRATTPRPRALNRNRYTSGQLLRALQHRPGRHAAHECAGAGGADLRHHVRHADRRQHRTRRRAVRAVQQCAAPAR